MAQSDALLKELLCHEQFDARAVASTHPIVSHHSAYPSQLIVHPFTVPVELTDWTTTEAEPINGGPMHRSFRQPVPVKDCQICAEPYPTKEQRRPGPKPKLFIDTVRTIGSLPSGWEIVSAISDLSKFVQSTEQRFSYGSAVVSLVGAFGAKIGGCPKTDKQLYVSHQELFTIL